VAWSPLIMGFLKMLQKTRSVDRKKWRPINRAILVGICVVMAFGLEYASPQVWGALATSGIAAGVATGGYHINQRIERNGNGDAEGTE